MQQLSKASIYDFQGFRVDTVRRQLSRGGELIPLTAKAFDTLLILIERKGETVSKADLMDLVWNDVAVEENNLTQQISTLRKAFGERPDDHRFIVTVPRRGYSFVAKIDPPFAAAQISSIITNWSTRHIDAAALRGYSLALAQIFLLICAFAWSAVFVQNDAHSQSVAILNFRVYSTGDEFIGSGISETLRARLGSVEDLIVRPVANGGEPQADVDLIVRGSVHRDGDRLRVVVEMLDVGKQRIVWGRTFDSSASGVFALQDSIAGELAAVLNVSGPPKRPVLSF